VLRQFSSAAAIVALAAASLLRAALGANGVGDQPTPPGGHPAREGIETMP
jgi:hypothetical protein